MAPAFQAQMLQKGPFTVPVPGAPSIPGEGIPRRHAHHPDALYTQPSPSIRTVWDLVQHGAKTFGDNEILGTRKVIKKHVETKKIKKMVDGELKDVDKEWVYWEMGPYQWMGFKEYERLVRQIGCGFRKLGLEKGDRVHIFAATSARWLGIAHGAMSQSMSIVTAYDTLGEEGLRHSLVATKAKAIFLEKDLLPILMKCIGAATEIKNVIVNDTNDEVVDTTSPEGGPKIMSFEDFRKLGESNPVDVVAPEPEDLACIMYTSGSGGPPKGVRILHKGIVAAVAGVSTIAHAADNPHITSSDVLLAYLPLAHIFEFTFETAVLSWGCKLGYGNPKTLSSTSTRNCKGDIQELRPTLLVGVPAVWEMVKKGIMANVDSASPVLRALFWGAFAAKKFLLQHGLPGAGVLDATVFKKVKMATGGRMRLCMNGAAPIAKETQEFISYALVPMINGYGMTETNAMGFLGDPNSWNTTASNIPSSIEIKLVDYADAGYFSANTPSQGEIWIRGPPVMDGYYDDEKQTAETITSDGWFKTADIGEWTDKGQLRVIDRKKNLVKTLNGEYIAIEKLESIYRTVTIVANICIYASPTETQPIAIVVLAEPALLKLAKEIGVEGHGMGDLVHDKRIQREVLKQMQAVGRKAGLASLEIVKGVVLADEEWTPQNGLMTPSMKLNRKGLESKYEKEMKEAYKS